MGDDWFFQPDLVPKQNTNSLQYLFPNAVPIRHLFSQKMLSKLPVSVHRSWEPRPPERVKREFVPALAVV